MGMVKIRPPYRGVTRTLWHPWQLPVEPRRRKRRGGRVWGGCPLSTRGEVWGREHSHSPRKQSTLRSKRRVLVHLGCYFLQLININWMETGLGHWVACSDRQWHRKEFESRGQHTSDAKRRKNTVGVPSTFLALQVQLAFCWSLFWLSVSYFLFFNVETAKLPTVNWSLTVKLVKSW